MKLKLSPLVAGASGSTADLTAANWKGRAYVRTKTTPSNPNSAAQQASRLSMTNMNTLWRDYSSFVHPAWADVAAALALSPFNAYVRANLPRDHSHDPVLAAPENLAVPAPLAFVFDSEPTSTKIYLTWDSSNAPAGTTKIFMSDRDQAEGSWKDQWLGTWNQEHATWSGAVVGHTYEFSACWYNGTTEALGTCAGVKHLQGS